MNLGCLRVRGRAHAMLRRDAEPDMHVLIVHQQVVARAR